MSQKINDEAYYPKKKKLKQEGTMTYPKDKKLFLKDGSLKNLGIIDKEI